MKNERQIAELIFDKFRETKSKVGHVVPMRSIRFGLLENLNPKEKELFFTVFNGLIFTGYFTYEKSGLESIRLTEKGYDYIYDDDKVEAMIQKPWIIPAVENTDWDKAYFKLWRVIGPQDTAKHYIGGPQFYKFIMELCDDIQPTYTRYIEDRKKKDQSTSRAEYYNDLINHLDDEKRKEFYVNVQLFLEIDSVDKDRATDDFSIEVAPKLIENAVATEAVVKELKPEPMENLTVDAVPNVFVSYSWDSQEHEDWVINLATKLCENGVNAILDKWDLGPLGKPLPNFMEKSISKSQRVICVMTPNYKMKTESVTGGVGYEYSIITAEIFTDGATTSKFIPLFRNGTDANAIPVALKGRKYVDMRDDAQFEEKFIHELLRDIHEEPKFKKPVIGKKPTFDK